MGKNLLNQCVSNDEEGGSAHCVGSGILFGAGYGFFSSDPHVLKNLAYRNYPKNSQRFTLFSERFFKDLLLARQ